MEICIDKKLVSQINNTDKGAFDRLYELYWEYLLSLAIRKTGDVEISMDLLQDLFVDLWERRTELKIEVALKPYLTSALYFKIFMYFRKKGIAESHVMLFKQMIQEETVEQIDFEQDIEKQYAELMLAIDQSVTQMPERMQVVFNLRFRDSLKINEIAKKLDISSQTVKNQLQKSLQFLRKKISHKNMEFLSGILFVLYVHQA
ncbi:MULTISPECIES: RNA polymerase sigma factor [Sphingobacterium]|uniref:Sigma-70 family RNA polymerase sigma factor n=1 Tax=Sphingobacterium hotanense TaxID=649196 RepID=A0ABT7NKA8_9SPHI|nr:MULTISPECIES: sigma-70 family RNA polymerase sigma factor [Sphingobacterium]MDM1047348.1 sigma-70 family RNA polymerase sigma factor [Sphingobacterium hotanense]